MTDETIETDRLVKPKKFDPYEPSPPYVRINAAQRRILAKIAGWRQIEWYIGNSEVIPRFRGLPKGSRVADMRQLIEWGLVDYSVSGYMQFAGPLAKYFYGIFIPPSAE